MATAPKCQTILLECKKNSFRMQLLHLTTKITFLRQNNFDTWAIKTISAAKLYHS